MSTSLKLATLTLISLLGISACDTPTPDTENSETGSRIDLPAEIPTEESSSQPLPETPTPDVSPSEGVPSPLYENPKALVDAAVEGGYECRYYRERNFIRGPESSAECNDQSRFTVYETRADLENRLLFWADLPTDTIVLVGEDWTIQESESNLASFQSYLGGEIHYIYEKE